MRNIMYILLWMIPIGICASGMFKPLSGLRYDEHDMQQWVDSVYNTLSEEERIGQLIMVVAHGNNTDANKQQLRRWINKLHIGGILFSASTPHQQLALTNDAQKHSKVPLMIALDGEWGLAMRLKQTTRFPRNMMLGAIQNDSLIYEYGAEVARQCRRMGIHINFAPTVDVNNNPHNPVIGMRSFGENPENVARKGILYARALEDHGILSVAKHFPGHGNTSTDSHHTLPVLNASMQELEATELYPFRKYIEAQLGGIMVGHLSIPALDGTSGIPASLSPSVVQNLLIESYRFGGLVFTDGLAMKGVSSQPNMAVRALLAGNDVLLGPVNPAKEVESIKKALQEGIISEDLIQLKCKKILAFKYAFGLNKYTPISGQKLEQQLNTSHAENLNSRLNKEAITLLKNDNNILPLRSLNSRKIALIVLGDSSSEPLRTASSYTKITPFYASDNTRLRAILSQIKTYNTIILSINSTSSFNEQWILTHTEGKDVVLNFQTTPYQMAKYPRLIAQAKAVLCSYENTPYARQAFAQALFGGITLRAKLPVSVKGIFSPGQGLQLSKSRLGYGFPEEVGLSSDKLQAIDSIVNLGLKEHAYPGCQVLVARRGTIVYHKSFGHKDYSRKELITPKHLYDLASITKVAATVSALAQLVGDGKMNIEDYLSTYIPLLKNTDKHHITITEALFHESGLPAFIPFFQQAIDSSSYKNRLFTRKRTPYNIVEYERNYWGNPKFKYQQQFISHTADTLYPYQVAKGIYTSPLWQEKMLQTILNAPLSASKRTRYSDINFLLLQLAIESISGIKLDNFLYTNIFRPLGAATLTYQPLKYFPIDRIVPTEKDNMFRKQLIHGYVHDETAALWGGVAGNAGLFSSAIDLAKLAQMWLYQGRYGDEIFLQENICRLFFSSQASASRRALGFDSIEMSSSAGKSFRAIGHNGFTGTCLWMDPDQEIVYIFLSNRLQTARKDNRLAKMKIRTRIFEYIYDAII